MVSGLERKIGRVVVIVSVHIKDVLVRVAMALRSLRRAFRDPTSRHLFWADVAVDVMVNNDFFSVLDAGEGLVDID